MAQFVTQVSQLTHVILVLYVSPCVDGPDEDILAAKIIIDD